MRELMAEEGLDALAVQEWPELPNTPGQWPYLAMSRLPTKARSSRWKATPTRRTALAARSLGAGVGYLTDWLEHDARTIHFWHAGIAPLGWCERASLGRHFNIDKPLVVDGPIGSTSRSPPRASGASMAATSRPPFRAERSATPAS